jgi:hypothetical protein
VESERDDSSVADVRRMTIRTFNNFKTSLKRTYKINSMNPKRTWIKKL